MFHKDTSVYIFKKYCISVNYNNLNFKVQFQTQNKTLKKKI